MECKLCKENRDNMFYTQNKTRCKKCLIEYGKRKYKENPQRTKNNYLKYQQNNILRVRYLAAKHRAIKKDLMFCIKLKDIEDLYLKQNGKCFYTGIEFENDFEKLKTVSIDRIDSKRGYTKNNIRLVCAFINTMKSDKSEKDFLYYIKLIKDNIDC